jgi:hypothetical protein
VKNYVIRVIIAASLLAAARQQGCAQGTFQNLNFESPLLPLVPDGAGMVPITNAMPGWAGYTYSTSPDSRVVYNDISIGSASIDFLGPGSGYQPFEGNYFVLVQRSFDLSTIPAIAQLDTVPSSAESLRFWAYGTFSVSFGGQQIPVSALASTSAYTIYGGDISSFAGQTDWLRFQGGGFLDNIQFSNLAIPEPAVFTLLTLGASLVAWRAVRGRCQRN